MNRVKRPPHLRIRAAAENDDEAEILIYDDIGASFYGEGVTAKQFIADIQEIEASTLNVRINSVGGSVFEGLAIHNALERHSARVVTHVDGIAASIASVIAMAGDEVKIAENAFLMVHNAHGIVMGNAADMREMADTLDKVGESLVGVYGRKTGRDALQVRAWMDDETWFNAEEAERYGFVDAVGEPKELQASAESVEHFRHVPRGLAAQLAGFERLEARQALAEFRAMERRADRATVAAESTALLNRARVALARHDVEWEPYPDPEVEDDAQLFAAWAMAHLRKIGAVAEDVKPPDVFFYRPKRPGQALGFASAGVPEIAISLDLPRRELIYAVAHEVAHVHEPEGLSKTQREARAHRIGEAVEKLWWRRH